MSSKRGICSSCSRTRQYAQRKRVCQPCANKVSDETRSIPRKCARISRFSSGVPPDARQRGSDTAAAGVLLPAADAAGALCALHCTKRLSQGAALALGATVRFCPLAACASGVAPSASAFSAADTAAAAAAPAAASALPAPHVCLNAVSKHAEAASTSSLPSPAPPSFPRPLPAHVIDSKRCLHDYGFAFAPDFGQHFAQQYIQLMGNDIAKRKKQTIAGGVEQFAMPRTGSSPWPVKLRVLWHALVARLAEHAGVDAGQLQMLINKKPADAADVDADTADADAGAAAAAPSTAIAAAAATTPPAASAAPPIAAAASSAVAVASTSTTPAAAAAALSQRDNTKPQLHVQDEKLLVAARQKGEQAPHFDRDDTADKLKLVYTVILYLTDGVDSTAFPQFALADFALPEFDGTGEVQNAAAMRATVERGCLEKERYDRWPVRIGDMALFTQATMHFGTKNNVLHERMALFSVLTPFEEKRQDDYQIYRWMYTGLACGEQSRELADSLWRDREFQPLDRFSANEAGRQSHQAYISCLLRWGYILWNPHTRRGQSRLQWTAEAAHRSAPLDDATVLALYHEQSVQGGTHS